MTQLTTPMQLFHRALEAYNEGDHLGFAGFFTEDAQIRNLDSDEVIFRNRREMEMVYERLFAEMPALHCSIISSIIQGGNIAAEIEFSGFPEDETTLACIMMAQVKANQIQNIWLLPK